MSERSAVQNPMLRYAEDIGWEYLPRQDALAQRGGESGLYLTPVLEEQLLRLNPGAVDESAAAEIIRQLNLIPASLEGNRTMLEWLRGQRSVFAPAENRQRNVTLIDFGNLDNNVFHVTDEWRYKGVVYANRADAVFLVNGIPLAIAETKAARRPDAMSVALEQLRRYHRETPEMMTAPQIFEITHLIRFLYGVTWNTAIKNVFDWREEESSDFERKVKAFFDRPRFLRAIRQDIVFMDKEGELTKVILRQHQNRAVDKVIQRVHDPTKRRGLIWHTQGSGKTLTMLAITSRLLRETPSRPDAEKPLVLMIVDRTELENQLDKNIKGYGISTYKVAHSKKELREILASDYRGLVVSMVHKFDDIPANINTGSHIVVLVDEAHRTTGGDLGNYLMAALPNATYIGLTGTPIDKLAQGKGTFKVFGTDDPQGYLDKYSIGESIEDGTTVRLHYALARSDLLVDRETLDREFLALKQAEGVSDIADLNAILDEAVQLKEMMKADTRVDKVAAAVAQHFRETVEPMGFKAFLVAVDREACAKYKKALDRLLPPEYSRVVYSPGENDTANLKAHYLNEEQEKDLRKAFLKKTALPKILIVTEKLLAGFDGPILYCMYLDKPMRDHVLLQAIARVNRPYEDEDGLVKPYGFVLDFVGLFDKLERALAFDSDVVASVIQNIDVLKQSFRTLMEQTAQAYLPLAAKHGDKALERAIEHFVDANLREEFYQFFRRVQTLYDILSPDADLRPYIDDYQALATLYAEIRNAYTKRADPDKELTRKTKELLRAQTHLTTLREPGPVYEIGTDALARIKASDATDTVKVVRLMRAIENLVDVEGESNPYLVSIGERAEAVRETYEARQMTTQQALAEFEKLVEEHLQADAERQRLGLDKNAFAVYMTLKPIAADLTPAQAQELDGLFGAFPDSTWNEQQERDLRSELYASLVTLVGIDQAVDAADAVLRLKRA